MFLSNLVLLAKNNKKTTINGRSIPFVTCANLIISIGLIPIDEKITPIKRTITAIILNKSIADYTPKDRLELDQAHFQLAKLYVKMNQLNMALENLDLALIINPSFQDAKREKNLILTKKEP